MRHHYLSEAMAFVVRCCCVLTGPNSGHVGLGSRPSGKSYVSGRLAFPFEMGKFVSCFGDNSSGPTGIFHILQPGRPGHLGFRDIEIAKPGRTGDIDQVPTDNGTITEHLSAHQGMVLFRFPATALAVTNALLLTIPFEALAETCEAESSFFNMPLLSFVALIGATVGEPENCFLYLHLAGLNRCLKAYWSTHETQGQKFKLDCLHDRGEENCSGLSYAPVGSKIPENEVIIDPKKEELISCLKAGKNFLRNQNPEKAFMEFKTALELARTLKDPTEEKKAARGLGLSSFPCHYLYSSMSSVVLTKPSKKSKGLHYKGRVSTETPLNTILTVLEISKREGENSGNTEAYGAIADCYTELGDLERAGKFYDQYIASEAVELVVFADSSKTKE
ncbi:Protein fluorescent in blue light, chloroplastic [Vitis vinifera]|uniref:Protein fluorescent in blue light, chloroplastic n=1 Tax=Vitis vinifera TaxID=29760 RepID=A0A438EWS7_VITVI|nr:Protein fluorescent in blue light, chloroplastic [Vitis vinifera]